MNFLYNKKCFMLIFVFFPFQKTPFATPNTNSDLGTFYRDCQSAPQLQAFKEEQTLAEQVGDLTKQLEAFEINMHYYEDLLNSLCKSESNNN